MAASGWWHVMEGSVILAGLLNCPSAEKCCWLKVYGGKSYGKPQVVVLLQNENRNTEVGWRLGGVTLRNALKNVCIFGDCHEYREERENKGASKKRANCSGECCYYCRRDEMLLRNREAGLKIQLLKLIACSPGLGKNCFEMETTMLKHTVIQ